MGFISKKGGWIKNEKLLSMETKHVMILISLFLLQFFSCNQKLTCERHYIPRNFLGKVKILFNQKNGEKEFDKKGCVIYHIPESGEYLSSLPFKEGNRYENGIFKCFETSTKDSLIEIPLFIEFDYKQDSTNNQHRKFVFLGPSGYENTSGKDPNYVLEYYIDYGINYRSY